MRRLFVIFRIILILISPPCIPLQPEKSTVGSTDYPLSTSKQYCI